MTLSKMDRFGRHYWVAVLILAAIWTVLHRGARAEIQVAHTIDPKSEFHATPIEPDETDFIRVAMDPLRRTTLSFGEPLLVNLRVINHTRFPIAMKTNFNPRSRLEIYIQAPRERERRYMGPFKPASYIDQDSLIYPLEERPFPILIWGDNETPNGLAFPAPGQYRVRISLYVGARGSQASGLLPVNRGTVEQPNYDPFIINVQPAPATFDPLVRELGKVKAYPELHLRHVPEGMLNRLMELSEQYPATPITPYITYTLARHFVVLTFEEPENGQLFSQATRYLQLTALADSAFKLDAYEDLVRVFDRWGQGIPAHKACIDLIRNAPPGVAGMYGSLPHVRKYLINSAEMDPTVYWNLLD